MTSLALLKEILIYGVAGSTTGLLAGLLGVGGGIINVPALLYVFALSDTVPADLHMHVATGSSLAIMLCTTFSATIANYFAGNVLWKVYYSLASGLVPGIIMGTIFASHLSTGKLQLLLALFLLLIAINMIINRNVFYAPRERQDWLNRLVGFVVGILSGILGIGGATLLIPYLRVTGIEMHRVLALAGLSTFTIALLGSVAVIWTGMQANNLPAYSTGFIYWPAVLCMVIPGIFFAPLGTRFARILSAKQLEYIFIAMLLLASMSLFNLWDVLKRVF